MLNQSPLAQRAYTCARTLLGRAPLRGCQMAFWSSADPPVYARRSLKCTRVTIHKNLFLSFITNNLMWVVWYTYVVNDANLLQSNPVSGVPA